MLRALRLAAAAALAMAAGADALAHAKLTKSEPAQRASLAKPPAKVRLCFNERLEPAFSRLSVRDAAGTAQGEGTAQVSAADEKCLERALPALKPGVYTVHFQVLSVDGHQVKSSFPFTVRALPAAQ